MTTIADCLTTLGVPLESLGSCLGLHEEFAVLKKAYFKSALAKHPDKGGDAAEFRKVHDAFEALRSLYDTGAVDCFATSASKCVGAQTPSDSSMPSWEFYEQAADEPVPTYRVEPAKSDRSKCSAKRSAKKCEDSCIPKGALRVGWLNAETGTYGRWANLGCWRVPSKVWLGLPDPEACAEEDLFKVALLSMSSIILSGVGELSPEDASAFTRHCMSKSNWAALVKRKAPKPTSAPPAASPAAAAASSALAASSTSGSALVADTPGEKRFVVPVPGRDGPANSLSGKTVVLTGIFPEVGGGAGLELGKARVKAMVEAFGGKVTSSVSGRTDVLIVGKEPGASKVGKAQSNGSCTLMSLHDMRQGLVIGSLEAVTNGNAPMVIQNFSKGFRGNGIGYAIKAPSAPAPPKPKPPVADPPPASADPLPASSVTPHEGGGVEEEGKGDSTPKPSMAKPAKAKAKKGGKKVDKEAAAEKRKANADLWLAVAPTTAPKKARGPPKDRSLS